MAKLEEDNLSWQEVYRYTSYYIYYFLFSVDIFVLSVDGVRKFHHLLGTVITDLLGLQGR